MSQICILADLTSFPFMCLFIPSPPLSCTTHTPPLVPLSQITVFLFRVNSRKDFSPGIPHGSRPGVREKERERECVCVCERERERERGAGEISVLMIFLCGDGLSLFY